MRELLFLSAIAWASLIAAAADEPTRFAADRPVDCLHIRLELTVDVKGKHIDGTAQLRLAALRTVKTITLDAVNLETTSVTVTGADGSAVAARHTNDGTHIQIMLEHSLAAGDRVTVTVAYSVDDPESGLHFFGPSENEPDIASVVWSQGESVYNSHWFPCFDNPNERQTTEMVITTDLAYEVSSNGRLVSRIENPRDGTVTVHWMQDTTHVAYLVSLIVGEFHIERDTWRGKPLEYWVHPRYREQISRSFRNTTRMLDFFSDSIGVEYPWDRYAQICCEGFGGGMENTSATTLGNRALHDQRSFLDSNSDGLIAHELAHQWWGDLLTCRDWAHLWLNEGFASYFEALWAEYDLGPDEFAYNMYRKAGRARSGGADRPIVDRAYRHSRSMFDSRAYPKGAWVVHMIRRRLGDELFWQVMNTYVTEHAYSTVETTDLRRTIEQVTGRSFERFFYDWTERPGHPELSVNYTWLNDEGLAKVVVKQTQESDAFHFPLALEFRFDDGIAPVTMSRLVTEKQETFYIPLPEAPGMLRVDPDQAVLMKLDESKGRDLWRAQLLHDPSAVARIRAARHFEESRSEKDHELLAEALRTEEFWGVRREIAEALAEVGGDIARDALTLGLAFENPKARRACVEQLDTFAGEQTVIDAVRRMVVEGDPSYSVEAAAIETYARLEPDDGLAVLSDVLRRDSRGEVIRGAALTGLGRLGTPDVIETLSEWTLPDKPRRARPSAIRALATVTREAHLDDDTYERIVEVLTANLDDTGNRVRMSAVQALGNLGEPGRARSAIPALEAITANDDSYRVRRMAERTIKTIRKGEPATLQLDELRDELKTVSESNKKLTDRLEKLEALLEEGQ